MKWKEILNKVNTKKYAVITGIKENIKLTSCFKNFYMNNKVLFYICLAFILFLVIFAYKTNIVKIAVTLIIIAFIALFAILKYTYQIEAKEKSLKVKMLSGDIDIPYDRLLNIFVQEDRNKLFFFLKTYKISIIFEKETNKMQDTLKNSLDVLGDKPNDKNNANEDYKVEQVVLELPTEMIDKKEVIQFFQNVQIEVLENQQKEEEKLLEEKRLTKKAILITVLIFAVVLTLTTIIVFAINKNAT